MLWKLSKFIFDFFPISDYKKNNKTHPPLFYQIVQPAEATVWRRTNIEIQYVDFVSFVAHSSNQHLQCWWVLRQRNPYRPDSFETKLFGKRDRKWQIFCHNFGQIIRLCRHPNSEQPKNDAKKKKKMRKLPHQKSATCHQNEHYKLTASFAQSARKPQQQQEQQRKNPLSSMYYYCTGVCVCVRALQYCLPHS